MFIYDVLFNDRNAIWQEAPEEKRYGYDKWQNIYLEKEELK
jgi:hypothetical protein